MRLFAVGLLTFVLGLVVGGYKPRADLREMEAKLEKAQDEACAPGLGQDLARMFALGRAPAAPAEPYGNPDQIAAENPEAARIAEEMNQAQREANSELGDGVELPAVPEDELNAARTALRLRSAQARAALVETADPSQQQLLEFDTAVRDMNERLLTLADDLTEMLAAGEPIERRDAMVFAAETLDTMIATEDRFNGLFDEAQLESADVLALDPFSYIDPAIVDTLAALGASAQ